MSSILTNMAAMSAVQNLAATQASLAGVQNEISTGLSVSSAKDNAAYYSIAQTMRTNVSNLSAVSSSLNLGASVVATASAATGQITSILQSISTDLVTAKSNLGNSNTQSYLNTAITALNQQLASVVSSASFNGANLLDGSSTGGSVSFVSGVTGTGANTAITSLTVNTAQTNLAGASSGTAPAFTSYNTALQTQSTDQATFNTDQSAFKNAVAAAGSLGSGTTLSANAKLIFGNDASLTGGVITVGATGGGAGVTLLGTGSTYTIATGAYANGATTTSGDLYKLGGASASGNDITQAVSGTGGDNGAVSSAFTALSTGNQAIASGALFGVGQISLSGTTTSAQIDSFIKTVGAAITAVNTAAENLGAASSQIALQSTYTSSLSDSLTSGVGSLVDADMNQASTRLSALQTQQQLGVQALSVANQNSQIILKLFQ